MIYGGLESSYFTHLSSSFSTLAHLYFSLYHFLWLWWAAVFPFLFSPTIILSPSFAFSLLGFSFSLFNPKWPPTIKPFQPLNGDTHRSTGLRRCRPPWTELGGLLLAMTTARAMRVGRPQLPSELCCSPNIVHGGSRCQQFPFNLLFTISFASWSEPNEVLFWGNDLN